MILRMFGEELVNGDGMPGDLVLYDKYRRIISSREAAEWFRTSCIQHVEHTSPRGRAVLGAWPKNNCLLLAVDLEARFTPAHFLEDRRTLVLGMQPEMRFMEILRLDALWTDAVFTGQDLLADVYLLELLDVMGKDAHVVKRWTDVYGSRLGH